MHNLAAALFAQGCLEMEFMLRRLGGSPVFAYGLPGAGDCFVTCAGGRSMRLGRLLGKGHTFTEAREIMAGETLEAAAIVKSMGEAIPKLQKRGVLGPDDLPLMRALVEVVCNDQPVDFPFDSFFENVPWL
jgi:glycerol-3-phosphate dehydrogenase (NAD(P)+)